MSETGTTSTSATPKPGDSNPSGGSGNALVTQQGRTSIADSVVTKIAGIGAREVAGVHDMGRGASRAFGALKERIPVGTGPSVSQGVSVEVGERQAAVDLDIVVEYGVSIPDVANAVRQNVIKRVEGMTGLEVAEVNISVDDVYLGDEESDEPAEPRVQ